MGDQFEVSITDSDDRILAREVMVRGESRTFEDITIGEVTINIGEACVFGTDLTESGAMFAVHAMTCSAR